MGSHRLGRIAVLALAGAASTALALPAWPAGSLTPVGIYRCDLTATFVQATTVSKDTYDVDPKIPASIKADLIAKYKHKYMKFACLRSEHYLLTWDREDPANGGGAATRTAEVPLDGDKKLVITWISYNIGRAMLNFQFQNGTSFLLPDIPSGTNYIMKIGEDPNPMILVITAKLVKAAK